MGVVWTLHVYFKLTVTVCNIYYDIYILFVCVLLLSVGVRLVGFATTSVVAPGYPSGAPMLMKIYSMLRECKSSACVLVYNTMEIL